MYRHPNLSLSQSWGQESHIAAAPGDIKETFKAAFSLGDKFLLFWSVRCVFYEFLPDCWDSELNVQPALLATFLSLSKASWLDDLRRITVMHSLLSFPLRPGRLFVLNMVYLWSLPVTRVKSYSLLSAGLNFWKRLLTRGLQLMTKYNTGAGNENIKRSDPDSHFYE